LAEVGCTAHEIMAITGHKTLKEVQRHTEEAQGQKWRLLPSQGWNANEIVAKPRK
jgi:hypothetical protein